MTPHIHHLLGAQGPDGFVSGELTFEIALQAAGYDWPHRDPFDRIIAATAQVMGLALVSKDATLDSVPGGLHRIW